MVIKRINILAGILLFLIFSAHAQKNRTTIGLQDGWKFHLGGSEFADNPNYNDANWETISLPHIWNAKDPFDDDETYFRGIGWYRRTLIDSKFQNKDMIREMIEQHYNHPAIVMWGSMNEVLLHNKQGDRIQKHDDVEYLANVRKYAISLGGYKIDVPEGAYEVTLYFIEPEKNKAGERVVDVSINNQTLINNLDSAAYYDFCQAVSKSFIVNAKRGEGLIYYLAKKGKHVICGVSVVKK